MLHFDEEPDVGASCLLFWPPPPAYSFGISTSQRWPPDLSDFCSPPTSPQWYIATFDFLTSVSSEPNIPSPSICSTYNPTIAHASPMSRTSFTTAETTTELKKSDFAPPADVNATDAWHLSQITFLITQRRRERGGGTGVRDFCAVDDGSVFCYPGWCPVSDSSVSARR